jgi:hypothetical protein
MKLKPDLKDTMTKNPLHPKKLLLSKWTDVHPQNKEKQYALSSLGKGYLPQFLEDNMNK